ncbi:MAG TPA: sugar ABC transporter permease [Gaiellaceae bacterium]|nr:sugar ABC transporter permease [Gaiellaceae bacterium]
MSVEEAAATRVAVAAKAGRPSGRPRLKDTWWRHLVALVAVFVALFPVVYIVSSAFNSDNNLSTAGAYPAHPTLHNFGALLHNHVVANTGALQDVPYLHWFLNSMLIAGLTALFTTMLGALAAYAFSRFRFKGRRLGMLALLLIQMFPQFVAVAAIYLIVYNLGGIFPELGLDQLAAVVIVYLGGSMGVQAWLMKGFFDTIPTELDESARVDGATAAQIFWGVVLPLAAPVLAVVALISFVFTLNEFVIASALLQTTGHLTLPVGMFHLIDGQYDKTWGPFTAGALLAALPVSILFMFLQRWIVSGLTAGSVKG